MPRIKPEEVVINADGSISFNVGTKTYGDIWATVSPEDSHIVYESNWSATKRRAVFYVRNGRYELLHRVIAAPPAHLVVDHIDGDPLNNRRANLRICTDSANKTFAADAKRGGPKPVFVELPTKEHVVKKVLADGTVREYRYKTRSKLGIVRKLASGS